MELKGSKTEALLRETFARELDAVARYRYFAAAARAAGSDRVADAFEAVARNEAEHAHHAFEYLGGAGGVTENLRWALQGEQEDAAQFYPNAVETAVGEGFVEIADLFRRFIKAEEKHQRLFRDYLEGVERNELPAGETVSHSEITMAHLMMPEQATAAGFVHGGELVKLMDSAAAVAAIRHCRTAVLTAMMDEIKFLHPVKAGDLVVLHACLAFASRSSVEVRVEVEVENLLNRNRVKATTGYFIMVAVDEKGKPTAVPALTPCTEEEERHFNQALVRYRARSTRSTQIENVSFGCGD